MSADSQNAVRTSVTLARFYDDSEFLSSLIAPLTKSRTI